MVFAPQYNGRRRRRATKLAVAAIITLSTILLLLQGPKLTLNIFRDIEDIVIGRVRYEPVIDDHMMTSSWAKDTAAKWENCRKAQCPSNYISKMINTVKAYLGPQIPKIIHQMSSTNKVSSAYAPYINSWINNHKTWSYMFWTDNDIETLIKTHYSQFLPLYQSYPYNIQRSDMARLLILYHYGGVYADLDYMSLQPLDSILENQVCVLTHEPKLQTLILFHEEKVVSNAFIACAAQHPLLEMTINSLANSRKAIEKWRGTFLLKHDARWSNYVTGPFVISRSYDHYMTPEFECCRGVAEFGVKMVDASVLSPIWDAQQMDFFKRKCSALESEHYPHSVLVVLKEECRSFEAQGYRQIVQPGAVARHDWLHLGYKNKEPGAQGGSVTDTITVRSVGKDPRTKHGDGGD